MMGPNIYGHTPQEQQAMAARLAAIDPEVANYAITAAQLSQLTVAEVLDALESLANAFSTPEPLYGVGARLGGLRRYLADAVGARRASSRWSAHRTLADSPCRVCLFFWNTFPEFQTVKRLPHIWRLWGGVGVRFGQWRLSLIYKNPRALTDA